jgi:hypothetical protein
MAGIAHSAAQQLKFLEEERARKTKQSQRTKARSTTSTDTGTKVCSISADAQRQRLAQLESALRSLAFEQARLEQATDTVSRLTAKRDLTEVEQSALRVARQSMPSHQLNVQRYRRRAEYLQNNPCD